MYNWAKNTFQLFRLCNGDFDAFCDLNICKDEAEQETCSANNAPYGGLDYNPNVVPNTGYDWYPYVIFTMVILTQTVVIMCLIYKRNNSNITYDYNRSVDKL